MRDVDLGFQIERVLCGRCYDIGRIPVAADVEPPAGTMYNYPIRPWHDSKPSLSGYPAPPEIAVQMYNRAVIPTMWAKLHSGQTIKQATDWAAQELEGFIR